MADKETIESPYSNFKETILVKLKSLKYIKDYTIEGKTKKTITIILAYEDGKTKFTDLTVISKPGQRVYVSYKDLKPVVSGFGYSILSTPNGIMTNIEARKNKVGGELLFNIW